MDPWESRLSFGVPATQQCDDSLGVYLSGQTVWTKSVVYPQWSVLRSCFQALKSRDRTSLKMALRLSALSKHRSHGSKSLTVIWKEVGNHSFKVKFMINNDSKFEHFKI